MAYSTNILPKSAAYYSLNNATIINSELVINAGGYAEIQVSNQMLPKLTSKMLVVVHPSVFSNSYVNDAVQVTLSVLTPSGTCIDYLIPVTYDKSGVFNTEIELPEEEHVLFTYRISSSIPVTVYNWELCAEEAVDVTTVIDGVEQSLPKLLYDYNTYSYAVAQKELTVGLISCYLQNATDLQGHFTISFIATEKCNVHVRIKDNGITELFTPMTFTVDKGYSSIGIPHAYLKKLATDHAFSVTMQCTNGQLSIPVRGMLYTIDGGYLATRLLDAGIDVEDISIKQLSTDLSPSEIWAVGFEGSRLILKKRVYSQAQREDWEAVKDFGEGIDAGVEFPGIWHVRAGSEKYTLETEQIPYVFVVDLDGVLRVYQGSSFDTITELDTEVTNLSVCQGYSSTVEVDQDQGMIVTYVKNGNVYYKQYIKDSNGDYLWQSAQPLYENGDAKFVNVHRLPDYRIGICVEHAAGTKWFITDRTYVGQAIKPELITPSVDSVTIATVLDADKAPDSSLWVAKQNTFSEDNVYHNGFVMTFDGPLHFINGKDLERLKERIVVYVAGTALESDAIKSVTIDNNVLTVILKEDVQGGNTVRITFNCSFLVMVTYNGCFAFIQQDYSWTLPLPTYYANHEEHAETSIQPTLDAIVHQILTTTLRGSSEVANASIDASLNTVVHQIITSTIEAAKENTSATVSGTVSIVVSQTGTTPV